MRGFSRSVLGYDRDEVDEALAAEQARLRELEAQAKRLGAKLDDRDRRLTKALAELEAARESVAAQGSPVRPAIEDFAPPRVAAPQPESGLGHLMEEIYAEATRQAAKFGDRAIDRSARLTARLLALGGMTEGRGGAGTRGDAGDRAPTAGRPAEGNSARVNLPDGVFDGEVEIEIGPLRDFAQLSGFEDAANSIGATGEIEVKRFSGGRATLAMDLDEPVELLRELEERAPLEFRVRSTKRDRVVLDVDEGEEPAAA